ncbi:Hypothetical predicted protein [Mytilus galloprovincialis]|uniref:Reverse transcriptase domain-containing protein n=1 Tax=Mytilus galloprovincialis TaxID=29158 RepID=A0A8B6HMP5_MYTGA|nr:Hypothetical predicted protein [Mytilus galloprovincialis]
MPRRRNEYRRRLRPRVNDVQQPAPHEEPAPEEEPVPEKVVQVVNRGRRGNRRRAAPEHQQPDQPVEPINQPPSQKQLKTTAVQAGPVPKKTGGLRLITHLSYPPLSSVNDFIDEKFTSVKYSSFDNAVNMVKKLGIGAKLAKMDIKSAFRLLPVYPGDFDLLGFKIEDEYYIDKAMAMGCSISCAIFEKFSTFLHWVLKSKSGSNNIDHYLDDFLFGGKSDSDECEQLMFQYDEICKNLGVPLANEKTEGPTTLIEYLGLTIDTVNMLVKIPHKKVEELLDRIIKLSAMKKVTLKELQSICGSLAFCTKALPAGRAFSCRLYSTMGKVSKPFHFIRVTSGMKNDLLMWKLFLEQFNGNSYINDIGWISNFDLELYTDSAGGLGKGCAAYLNGKWTFLEWPNEWNSSEIFKDITYLENHSNSTCNIFVV